MDHDDRLALLEGEVAALAAALKAADPAREISACPGWTVSDLTAHVTAVHRWVLRALSSDTPPAYDEIPADAEDYAVAGERMVAALRALPPDAACWTFDRNNRTAAFWRRRQVLEIAIHRWDAGPYDLTDDVAADGIDEVLDFMLPRQVALGRTVLPPGTLRLQAPGRTWDFGDGRPVTTVTGTPSDLLLWLWGRIDLDGTGDPAAWRAAGLTP